LQTALEFQLHSREVLMFSLGMYLWEFLVSLWFELYLCLRWLPFKWPLVPYFLARYTALIGLISAMLLALGTGTKPLDCRALFRVSLVFGNSAIAAASCNLMVRAIVIWAYQWYIIIPLTVAALGQWVLFGVGFRNSESRWSPEARVCTGDIPDLRYVGAFGLYTAGFDLSILFISLVGLKRVRGSRSFINDLRTQGIVYCALVLVAHSIMAICAFAVPDVQYSSFSGVMAMSLSPAVSCRMVRSILKTDVKSRGWRENSTAPVETMDGLALSTRINLETAAAADVLPFDHMKHDNIVDPRSIP